MGDSYAHKGATKNSTTFSNFKWLKMTLMTDDDTNRVCIIHGKYVLPMSIHCHSPATDCTKLYSSNISL